MCASISYAPRHRSRLYPLVSCWVVDADHWGRQTVRPAQVATSLEIK